MYKNAPYILQILENLDVNGRAACVAPYASVTPKISQKEKQWILKLQTVFHYGLHDRLVDDFIGEDVHVLVASKFPALLRNSIN